MKKKHESDGAGLLSRSVFKILRVMKLMMVLICFVGLLSSFGKSYSQNTKLSIEFKNSSIENVLNYIESRTEYSFMYDNQKIDINREVSINVKNETVESILNQIFGNGVKYQIIGKHVIITPKDNQLNTASQQSHTITGRVTDVLGVPMPGVTVVIKGQTKGTITDSDGNYSIVNVPANATLHFSFVGMKTQVIDVVGKSIINIAMVEETIGIDEVVAIGYGTRSKRDVTTAISTIGSEKIAKIVPSSPELLMQGQMSGVQVVGNQGNPSARPTVRIRGTNTFGISDPLYVIDGIPVKEWGAGIEGTEGQWTRGSINIMAMIDPSDIESISVLKDAAAGAIYGVKAANGVVLITTKKGRKEKTEVNYSQRLGFQNMNQEIKLLNTKQYVDFNNALYASDPNSDGSRNSLNEVFRPDNPNYLGNLPTYNWQKAIKNKNAMVQDYSVSVSGGTEKADYYLSLGYSDQEGVYIDNTMKRYSGSFKINLNINKYFRVGVNYRLSTAKARDMSEYIGSLNSIALTPVCQPIYDPNGINGFAQVVKGYDDKGIWNSSVLYGSWTRYNMPGFFSLINGNNTSMRNMGNAYVELEPLKGLKLRGTMNIDYFDNTIKKGTQYIASYFKYDGGDPNNIPGSVGDYNLRKTINFNRVGEFSANYTKSLNKHNIDLLFNTSAQKFVVDHTDVGTDYVTTTNPNLVNLGGEKQYTRTSGFKKQEAFQGFLFRSGYNYDNKYYLDATIRRDGSVRFSEKNRWGTFPGVSIAWRISKEDFMNRINWLNDLKLRTGWGSLGNDEVTPYAYLSTITTRPTYAWGNNSSPRTNDPNTIGLGYTSSGAAVYSMANESLHWEKTSTFNIGLDAVMINNINFSFEYYNKLTDGILQDVTLPPSAGVITMPEGNVAQVRNSGIEMNLNYKCSVGDLDISLGGNLTTTKNRVEKLYGGIPMWNIEEGQSLFYIRGYKLDGIFQSDEEAQAWLGNHSDVSYQSARIRGGDFHFKDLRGAPNESDIANGINKYYSPQADGIVDSYDQVYLGKTIPGFYYGFYVNAGFKGFDFSVQFTGVGDVQKVNNVKQSFGMPYGEAGNHTYEVLDAWTPTNKNTNVPRMIYQDPAANERFSDYFVENAGYLRLANMQLGYTFPKQIYTGTNNVLRNARIYMGCSNLFTITKYNGLDPEDENNPSPLIVYTGLNIKF